MEFFNSIREDFRSHRNIEKYFAIIVIVIVLILRVVGKVDSEITASVTLAVLAIVTSGLLQNRRQNDNILKMISTTESLDARISELTHKIGRKFEFVRTDRGNYGLAKSTVRSLIDDATKEVLILDYNPLPKIIQIVRNLPQDIISDERRKYYDELVEKCKSSKPGEFRYRRILQLPDGHKIADILAGDTILKSHCNEVIKISAQIPEIVSLKACPTLHEGAFILIDSRYLVVDINMLDPDNHYYVGGGHFLFEDPTGELIATFRLFFERADSHATPVRLSDLS